jgi:sugar lactone lactonase YvrE
MFHYAEYLLTIFRLCLYRLFTSIKMSIIRLFYYFLFLFPVLTSTATTYVKLIVNRRAASGVSGDGTPALQATISSGEGTVWVDTNGNLFLPDQNNHKIRKVSAGSEIMSSFGGTGNLGTAGGSGPILGMDFKFPVSIIGDTAGKFMYMSDQFFVWRYNISSDIVSSIVGIAIGGFSGDSGPASQAQLSTPRGLWLTTDNTLYIADSGNFRIRKVSPTGIITTVVGTAVQDSTGDGGPAISASLNQPVAVYVDTLGFMFIADFGAKNVRRVDPNLGDIITRFAGVGGTSAAYNGDGFPAIYANMGSRDVKGDTLGNIYIVDTINCRIRKVDVEGIVSTFLGTGVCAVSLFLTPMSTAVDTATPRGLWIDSQANFYFTESSVIVRRTIVAGSAVPTVAPTSAPASNTYLKVLAGVGNTGYSGDSGPALLAQISPVWLWVAPSSGNIYVLSSNKIRLVSEFAGTKIVALFGGTGASSNYGDPGPIGSTSFYALYSVVGDTQGNSLFFSDQRFIWQYSFSSGIVSVIAGVPGSQGLSGDNGPAAAAQLSTPLGIWLSATNDLYIADSGNHRIRKISSGTITTEVGTIEGDTGDGGPALSAQLRVPSAGCLDSVGKMYFIDSGNNRVRMVDTSNIITAFAGNGVSGTIYLGDNIPATQAILGTPKAVTVDSLGNVYISGNGYKRIVVVNPAGILTTYIGTGLGGSSLQLSPLRSNINSPGALWMDSQDNLYFADTSTIRKTVQSTTSSPTPLPIVPPSHLFQQVIAGGFSRGFSGDGGPANSALMNPASFWISTGGAIFVPDYNNFYIRKINPNGIINNFGGSGSSSTAGTSGPIGSVSFNVPAAIVGNAAGSRLYISDLRYVWQYTFGTGSASVIVRTSTGFSGDDGPSILAELNCLAGLWMTTGDDLYIADYANHRIRKISMGIITTVAGSENGMSFAGDNGPATTASLSFPVAVYVDTMGSLFISDYGNGRIRLVNTAGIIFAYAGTGLSAYNGNNIPATLASLNNPVDIKGDSLGNIYVADTKNCLIRVINTAGIISTVVGNEGVCWATKEYSPASSNIDMPAGIWVDSLGTIYFSSNYNSIHRTFLLTPTSMPSDQPSGLPTQQPISQPSRRPSSQPSSVPSSQPSKHPSSQPSGKPSAQPSCRPSSQPSRRPTAQPSAQPSRLPTRQPVSIPTCQPSSQPTRYPSAQPSSHPSRQPTTRPSEQPSSHPSCQPSSRPSSQPSRQPTRTPTVQPSSRPTGQPSSHPSGQPSRVPSGQPTSRPSCQPSSHPSGQPTRQPVGSPSAQPSLQPTSQPSTRPSCQPTRVPSGQPTSRPSRQPSSRPSSQPTGQPTGQPSGHPSRQPTTRPSGQPTSHPSCQPSSLPSSQPTRQPTRTPTVQPSSRPTGQPSSHPSRQPTRAASSKPSARPSCQPTSCPSSQPTRQPVGSPRAQPSFQPTNQPSAQPSCQPTRVPSGQPTCRPSCQPTRQPIGCPSAQPSVRPSRQPTARPSAQPTSGPSCEPSSHPSSQPTGQPTRTPSAQPSSRPTSQPSSRPPRQPTTVSSGQPSTRPSSQPISRPSSQPTGQQTVSPSMQPSSRPSSQPSSQPSWKPTIAPSGSPSSGPSCLPTSRPSCQPTRQPTGIPSASPNPRPTGQPSLQPSIQPTGIPSSSPSPHL